MHFITGKTKILGIIGDPVEHSLSPVMQNEVIKQLGVDYVYIPFLVHPGDLATAIAGFTVTGVVGLNVTIPHKQAIIPFLSEISASAQLVGAVNTIWKTETGWKGTNTDVKGFMSPLNALNQSWKATIPVILGNGGAARAVVVGCYELGCREIAVVGRDINKLEQFKQSWVNTPLEDAIKVYSWDKLAGLVSKTQLLINTTPVGMSPHIDASPVSASVMARLTQEAIAYDLIYTPNPTRFLQQAQQQGARIIDGLEMLVQQGAAALQLWLERPIPIAVMRHTLRKTVNSKQ